MAPRIMAIDASETAQWTTTLQTVLRLPHRNGLPALYRQVVPHSRSKLSTYGIIARERRTSWRRRVGSVAWIDQSYNGGPISPHHATLFTMHEKVRRSDLPSTNSRTPRRAWTHAWTAWVQPILLYTPTRAWLTLGPYTYALATCSWHHRFFL